jgi:hypothetical protein
MGIERFGNYYIRRDERRVNDFVDSMAKSREIDEEINAVYIVFFRHLPPLTVKAFSTSELENTNRSPQTTLSSARSLKLG